MYQFLSILVDYCMEYHIYLFIYFIYLSQYFYRNVQFS